ncbi:MAG: hypothetical protein F6K37_21275 [Moorea sp. SIO4E2]|nr:hypothetical protein [Moorena sp. SIO4E2]NEQ08387.1 hypothetical protein [Moorena sp. SIO4E2]
MILRVFWNGHVGGMGILRGTGILVELASCQFHAYFRAGRMPTYFRAGRMPTLLLFIRRFSNAEFFLIPYSLVIQPNR